MSIRVRCRSCQTAFVTDDDPRIHGAVCPKCGAKHVARPPKPADAAAPAPAPVAAPAVARTRSAAPPEPEESVFVPSGAARGPRRGLKVAVATLCLLTIAGVGVAVSWPAIQRWWHPVPPDPIEAVATSYLKALAAGDAETTRRLGTVDLPPAIRSFRSVRRKKTADFTLKGSFGPISAFHAKVEETYAYDPAIGRYAPKNPLGAAAETLDALHDAKAKSEQDQIAKKIQSGDPEDIFDAAEGMAKAFSKLADGVLSPKKLLPTYQMLVDDAKPPLPAAEKELALDFAANRETWDALLKRPFATLKTDGPFVLERADVAVLAVDALGSSGDPPTPLTLSLTRFRLETIDTQWRVTGARRGNQAAPKAAAAPKAVEPPPKVSPGEAVGGQAR